MLRADVAAAVSGWTCGLLTDGQAWPWRAGTRRRVANVAACPRLAALDDRKRRPTPSPTPSGSARTPCWNLPPGTEVWRGGETIVVGENDVAELEDERSA